MATGSSGSNVVRPHGWSERLRVYAVPSLAAWVRWILVSACLVGLIVGIAVHLSSTFPNGAFDLLAWGSGLGLFFGLPTAVVYAMPRLTVDDRGILIRDGWSAKLLPWSELGDVALVRGPGCRVIVAGYAKSLATSFPIRRRTAEQTFAILTERIREFRDVDPQPAATGPVAPNEEPPEWFWAKDPTPLN